MRGSNRLLIIILALVIVCVAAASIAVVVTIAGWLAPSPLTYQLPNKVDPDVVHPGDPITITLRRCVQDGINGQVFYTVSSTLVERDGLASRRQLLQNSHTVPEGCSTSQATFKEIPADLEPGVWHLESAIVAYGAHGPKLLYTTTEWFTVLPAEAGDG
jgi:hypothetical protein